MSADHIVIGTLAAGETLTEERLAQMFTDYRRDHPGERLFLSPGEMALSPFLTTRQIELAHAVAANFADRDNV